VASQRELPAPRERDPSFQRSETDGKTGHET